MSDEISVSVDIPLDEEGMLGRECLECERYFKLKPGTGLPTNHCHCPYCDYEGDSNTFWTQAQLEYAKSIAMPEIHSYVQSSFNKMFKDLQRKNRNSFIRFEANNKKSYFPIKYYEEKELETKVTCDNCGLEFAVYGVFANCPDCNQLNAFLIYKDSLEVTRKKLAIFLKPEIPDEVREDSLKHILSDCVSTFDALGKELRKKNPDLFEAKGRNLFQKIGLLNELMKNRLSDDLDCYEELVLMFKVRHIYEHNMGVIDEDFIKYLPEYSVLVGQKFQLNSKQLEGFISNMEVLGGIIEDYYNSFSV